jgi:hypothetical protein
LIAGRSYLILNYCPACGGRLPPSRRWAGARFETLAAEVSAAVGDPGSLDEVEAQYGPPDEWSRIGTGESGVMRWFPTLEYFSIRPGLRVTFWAEGEGRVRLGVAPHFLPSELDRAGFRWRGNW